MNIRGFVLFGVWLECVCIMLMFIVVDLLMSGLRLVL